MEPKFNSRPNHPHSTADGRTIWESRSVVAVAAVLLALPNRRNEILLVQRAQNDTVSSPGKWCMPCGYFDYDETGVQAAQREVWEETQVNITDWHCSNDPWKVNTDPSVSRQDVILYYWFLLVGDRRPDFFGLPPENEIAKAQWFEISKIRELDLAFKHKEALGSLPLRHLGICF